MHTWNVRFVFIIIVISSTELMARSDGQLRTMTVEPRTHSPHPSFPISSSFSSSITAARPALTMTDSPPSGVTKMATRASTTGNRRQNTSGWQTYDRRSLVHLPCSLDLSLSLSASLSVSVSRSLTGRSETGTCTMLSAPSRTLHPATYLAQRRTP
jgi:hypothetical protein